MCPGDTYRTIYIVIEGSADLLVLGMFLMVTPVNTSNTVRFNTVVDHTV